MFLTMQPQLLMVLLILFQLWCPIFKYQFNRARMPLDALDEKSIKHLELLNCSGILASWGCDVLPHTFDVLLLHLKPTHTLSIHSCIHKAFYWVYCHIPAEHPGEDWSILCTVPSETYPDSIHLQDAVSAREVLERCLSCNPIHTMQ
jgi:hypothetical protein